MIVRCHVHGMQRGFKIDGLYWCPICNPQEPLWDMKEEPTKPNKYTRHVKGADIDVYDVLRAWDVTCPAIQHAVKKLLAPGQRGHKDRITDLREALASVQRGIEMEEGK